MIQSYDLELAPNTVAKTYYLLQKNGFLDLKDRKGTFVSERWKSFQKSSDLTSLNKVIDKLLAESKEKGIRLDVLFGLIKDRKEL